MAKVKNIEKWLAAKQSRRETVLQEVPDRLLTQSEVKSITGQSDSTLEQNRLKGRGVPFVRVGRSVRYRLSDVMAFIENLPTYHSTTEADTGKAA